jgi:hypothetical protein
LVVTRDQIDTFAAALPAFLDAAQEATS